MYKSLGSHDMKIHVYKLGEKGIEDISKVGCMDVFPYMGLRLI